MASGARTLVLLRHAKSIWPQDVPDPQRALSARGERDARAVGRWLAEQQLDLDLVLCSPAVRARQTWEHAAAALTATVESRYEPRIYEASAGDLFATVQDLPATVRAALLVGHNPAMEDLQHLLTGVKERFRTATLAVLDLTGDWADIAPGSARPRVVTTPRG